MRNRQAPPIFELREGPVSNTNYNESTKGTSNEAVKNELYTGNSTSTKSVGTRTTLFRLRRTLTHPRRITFCFLKRGEEPCNLLPNISEYSVFAFQRRSLQEVCFFCCISFFTTFMAGKGQIQHRKTSKIIPVNSKLDYAYNEPGLQWTLVDNDPNSTTKKSRFEAYVLVKVGQNESWI